MGMDKMSFRRYPKLVLLKAETFKFSKQKKEELIEAGREVGRYYVKNNINCS